MLVIILPLLILTVFTALLLIGIGAGVLRLAAKRWLPPEPENGGRDTPAPFAAAAKPVVAYAPISARPLVYRVVGPTVRSGPD